MKYNTNCNHEYKKGLGLKKIIRKHPNRGVTISTQHEVTDSPVLGTVNKCIHCGDVERASA